MLKDMKKGMLIMVSLLAAAGLSFAQPGNGRGFGTPEENAQRMTARLAEELKLSPAQRDSVYAYVLEQGKATRQLFQEGREGDREQMRTKMTALREETDRKILGILNDDQKIGYREWIAERQSRMRNGGPGGPGGRPSRGNR